MAPEILPSSPVDTGTASLLDLIASDDIHAADRAKVDAAIRQVPDEHGGQVDPNRVRALLTNEHGLTVYPRLLSARYSVLARAGVLVADGWTENRDRAGRNAGKPQRVWKYVA